MKKTLLGLLCICLVACSAPKVKNTLEVTTFRIKTTANSKEFAALDAQVEKDFTSLQPGFLHRQSALDENGNYTVLVYWKTEADAQASMEKFMSDPSVAKYASMIDGPSMQMKRYTIEEAFDADTSSFIEVMEFKTSPETTAEAFDIINDKVTRQVSAPKAGFLQRIRGHASESAQVVVVYWDSKAHSDDALQPFMQHTLAQEFMGMMDQTSIRMLRSQTLNSLNNQNMELTNKDKVVALLNSFNTGDKEPISYINPEKYIQHNLSVGDGLEGFGAVMQHAPEGGFGAEVLRAFEDGDYVFTHTKYDFFGPKAGFDVFRFEKGLIVEHWDNLIEVQPPNPSGRTQFDGSASLTDLDKTEENKQKVQEFIEKVLIKGEMDQLTSYVNPQKYLQHNPAVADGLDGLGDAMKFFAENNMVMEYHRLHKVLGQGNFVLSLSEGKFGHGEPTAFYDLFRLEEGLIIEHWDVISTIPPKSEWQNSNGKF